MAELPNAFAGTEDDDEACSRVKEFLRTPDGIDADTILEVRQPAPRPRTRARVRSLGGAKAGLASLNALCCVGGRGICGNGRRT
jgi:hypothetical protein